MILTWLDMAHLDMLFQAIAIFLIDNKNKPDIVEEITGCNYHCIKS